MAVASDTTTGLRASVRPGALRIGGALTLAVAALVTLSATVVLTLAGGDSPWWLASSGAVIVPAVAGALMS